jgi:hypothetical protein
MSARLVAATALAAGAVGALPAPAVATGGIYNVVKCHDWHLEADEFEQVGSHPSYATVDDCLGTSPDRRLGIYNTGAAGNNAYTQFEIKAPPATHFETVCLDHRLRRDAHHRAEIFALPGFELLAAGGDGPGGWVNQCFDVNSTQLIVRLACGQGGGCSAGLNAHAYVRNVVLAVSDDVDPVITAFGGDLLSGGWVRGSRSLVADANDAGAGAFQLVVYANGLEVIRPTTQCNTDALAWNFSPRLLPCEPGIVGLNAPVDTRAAPFGNGANEVAIYAADYAANTRTETRTVYVDNAPPAGSFAKEQRPDDPELIVASVSDAHSGVASAQMYYRAVGVAAWQPLQTRIADGEASARVESSGVPLGEYEFLMTLSDIAGNPFETTLRADGTPMRLTFPLRSPVELRTSLGSGGSTGQTVPYGTRSRVHGRLLDAHGEPIEGQEVVVVDTFDNGALFPRAERPAVTDDEGRFATPVPAGPTRSIEAVFAGTNRYLPAEDEVGLFEVKGAASFRTSAEVIREGSALAFTGRVRHHGARIPSGGKLVEVQYRLKTGRQRTLKKPFRTEPDGSYRLVYRFSKALTADALFHFRLKVWNEGDWPFKGTVSRWREVTVRAH